ncbi:MAG TPA: polysaccharide biosynthesis tyrosine autokinase [Gemmataceae bacterium]|jgi:capsular exopolysaccharide synthesis family protein|nr:polysaccharide biosynthesis tyrosine autokinase [Gemmataceae bacterium]
MLPVDPNGTSSGPQPVRVLGAQDSVYPAAATDDGLSGNGSAVGSSPGGKASGAAFLHAFRRRWYVGASLGLVCAFFAVALACWLVPPRYRAQSLIHVAVSPPRGVFMNQTDYMSSEEFTAFMKTQTAVLKTRPVLEAALRQPQIAELPEVSGQPDPLAWLEKHLEVDTTLGAEILRVSLSGDRPDEVAAVLNAIADAYVQQVSQREQSEHLARLQQLQENYRQYQDGLRAKRAALKELEDQLHGDDAQNLTLRYPAEVQQLKNTESLLLQTTLDLNKTVKELEGLQEQEKRPPAKITIGEAATNEYLRQDPIHMRLVARLATIEEEIEQIRAVSKGDSQAKNLEGPFNKRAAAQAALDARRREAQPQVQAYVERKTAEERAARLAKLKTDKVLLEDRARTLSAAMERQKELVKRMGSAIHQPDKPATDLEVLRQEVKQREETAKRVAEQIEIMRVEPRPLSRASLLEAAEPPRAKSYQVQIKVAGAAGFGAFALALCGVTWREQRARKVYAAADVVENLGLKLIGTLPALPARVHGGDRSNGRALRVQNALCEAVDALRAQLLRAADRDGVRVVMIASANAGEGKTALATQLAASLARAWRKTLLIDGDLRHPGIHRQFDMPPEPGFSEVLRGEAECDDVVRPTPLSRLWLIPAGHGDAHATQALAQKIVPLFLERLKEQYDFIIVDSSPVLPVADALSLGQHVDAVVLAILRDVSRLPAVQTAYQRLASLGIRMLGTIMLGAGAESGSLGYPYPARIGQ